MKKQNRMAMWLTVLGLGVTLPLAAMAQPGGGSDGGDPSGEFQKRKGPRGERMKAMHARLLKEKVGLDDQRVAEVQAVHKQFRDQRKALREDMKTAHEALRLLVDGNSNDTRAFEKALADAKTARERLHALRKAEMEAVADLLTPKEQATLMVSMHKVKKHFGKRGGKGQRGEWRGHRGPRGEGFGPRGGGFGPGPDAFDGDAD